MTQPMEPMTTKEFAEATGISTASISKLIRDGKIKAKKAGKAWMIPRSQLESDILRKIREAPKAAKRQKPFKAAAPIKPTEAPPPEVVEPELSRQAAAFAAPARPAAAEEGDSQPADKPTLPEKSYSIPEFAAMTYLTEKGVSEWLRIGRLVGCKTETGEWRVLGSNLDVSDISRLKRR